MGLKSGLASKICPTSVDMLFSQLRCLPVYQSRGFRQPDPAAPMNLPGIEARDLFQMGYLIRRRRVPPLLKRILQTLLQGGSGQKFRDSVH